MCLIIHREKDSEISAEFLENVRSKNPDGWGILYHNRRGQARVVKGLEMSDFWAKFRAFEKYNSECIIHFRYATKGSVNRDNAHPYLVLGGKNPIYLMHNGTISIEGAKKNGKLSDTRIFIRDVLKPMLEHIKNPHEFIRTKHFEFMMESVAGDNSSRFVLFDHEGSLFYGGWYKTTKGVWVSNTYAYTVDNAYTKKVTYPNYSSATGYWDVDGQYNSYASSNAKSSSVVPFDSDRKADWSAMGEADDIPEDAFYDAMSDEEDEWISSIQDVADNFETIAELYWDLDPAEIEFAIQQFYLGNWEFFMNENLPQYSMIRDFDGNVIEPEEIVVSSSLIKSALARQAKEKKKASA